MLKDNPCNNFLPGDSHGGTLRTVLGDKLGRFSGRGDGDDGRGSDVVGGVDRAHRSGVSDVHGFVGQGVGAQDVLEEPLRPHARLGFAGKTRHGLDALVTDKILC